MGYTTKGKGERAMYIGRQSRVKREIIRRMTFGCRTCGLTREAMVTGIGVGIGNSPYFMDNEGAKRRAGDKASANSEKNMRLNLRLARCPQCGARDGQALLQFIAKNVFIMLFSLVVEAVFGLYVFIILVQLPAVLYILAAVLLGTGLYFGISLRAEWKRASTSVKFL
jgi:hypothetical protein